MRSTRRHCRSLLSATAYALLAYASVSSAQVLAKEPSRERPLIGSFSTRYRYSEENNLSISISVEREGAGYRLGFQGYGRALHGHAPEGSGEGEIKDGIFRFQFQDSFSNRGTGTFRRVGRRYLLHIDISEVAESRIMAAYGDDIPLYRDKT
jgi:hypothetical protein